MTRTDDEEAVRVGANSLGARGVSTRKRGRTPRLGAQPQGKGVRCDGNMTCVSTTSGDFELSDDELRSVAAYAGACARQALPLFEHDAADDTRPRTAIEQADTFAGGHRRTKELRTAAWAALEAARDAPTPAGADAARAASHAAAAAYLHPIAQAHQIKHILGAAAHAAHALEQDSSDAGAAEEFLEGAADCVSPTVLVVLRRYPSAPAGGGRVGELLRQLDAALRAP